MDVKNKVQYIGKFHNIMVKILHSLVHHFHYIYQNKGTLFGQYITLLVFPAFLYANKLFHYSQRIMQWWCISVYIRRCMLPYISYACLLEFMNCQKKKRNEKSNYIIKPRLHASEECYYAKHAYSFSFNEISAIMLYRIIYGTFSGLFGNSKTIHRGKCT